MKVGTKYTDSRLPNEYMYHSVEFTAVKTVASKIHDGYANTIGGSIFSDTRYIVHPCDGSQWHVGFYLFQKPFLHHFIHPVHLLMSSAQQLRGRPQFLQPGVTLA